jgi:WD40-like Beta Propeller Repeat
MTTNSALSASLRSLRLRRLLAGVGVLAFAAVAFTGLPAWGEPREKIVFTNTADILNPFERTATAELYIVNPDGSKPTRLTNDGAGDALAALSPDGTGRIVFDSNRIACPPPCGANPRAFDSDLLLLNPAAAAAGVPKPPIPLTRGSSASFDPSGKNIAYHRSASLEGGGGYGTRIPAMEGTPARNEPGGPTRDSDIFLVGLLERGEDPVNLTNGLPSTPGVRGVYASDDVDWSPDGKWIAFTSRRCPDQSSPTCGVSSFADQDLGIYVMNLETRLVTKLTNLDNLGTEERSPAWSPDSTKIAIGRRPAHGVPFDIWVLDFDPGTPEDPPRVTNYPGIRLSGGIAASWSPTGREILGCAGFPPETICVMNADGSNQHPLTPDALPGRNGFAKWGIIAVGHDPQ